LIAVFAVNFVNNKLKALEDILCQIQFLQVKPF